MKVIWRQIECLFLDLGCICFGSIVFMRYTAQAQANAVQHTFTPELKLIFKASSKLKLITMASNPLGDGLLLPTY